MSTRRGSILVLVAGISALLAAMTMAFIINIRNESEEVRSLECYTQNRIMLHAALSYIQESSRLGYGSKASGTRDPYLPAATANTEAYGWLDVRGAVMALNAGKTANTGPYAQYDANRPTVFMPVDLAAAIAAGLPASPLARKGYTWEQIRTNSGGTFNPNPWPLWEPFDWRDLDIPIHLRRAGRFPVYAVERPPFAVGLDAAPNPIGGPWKYRSTVVRPADANGYPLQILPDTAPITIQEATPSTYYDLWRDGDLRMRTESANRSWFRLFRDGPTTFVITVGSGGSKGFKNWSEVLDPDGDPMTNDSQVALFPDAATFEEMLSSEQLQWFRCEWTPRIGDVSSSIVTSGGFVQDSWPDAPGGGFAYSNDNYFSPPTNGSLSSQWRMAETEMMGGEWTAQPNARSLLRNYGGTFLWIQRLRLPPTFY